MSPISMSFKAVLPWLLLSCALVIMPVWPVMSTMALRNLLLLVGGIIGLIYVIQYREVLGKITAIPLFLLITFFVWVCMHLAFFAQNPVLEQQQLTGTWLRSLLACFLGVGTGLYAKNHPRAQYIVWASFLLFLVVFSGNYIWSSYSIQQWAVPYPRPYEFGVYGLKLASVYYGMIVLGLSCGVIAYQLNGQNRSPQYSVLLASFIVLLLSFFAFVIADSKNGVAMGAALVMSLFFAIAIKAKRTVTNISIAIVFLSLVSLGGAIHLKHHPEWFDLWETAKIGVQIDKYPNWQSEWVHGLPKLPDGSVANQSSYERTALATEGVRLLSRHPLGYGMVDSSFKYLVVEDIPKDADIRYSGTHAGWLDFALGVGIPGLLIVWAAIISAIYISFGQQTIWSFATRWILGGIFITWIVAEVSTSHFVETLFYLIALLSAGNITTGKADEI